FPLSDRSATMPTGVLTSISSMVLPARSINTACPATRFPSGVASAVVTPSMRVTGISIDAGFRPSATLNAAAIVSPRRKPSRLAELEIGPRLVGGIVAVVHEPAIVVDLHGPRVDRERVARPHDHVCDLPRLERPDERIEPDGPGGIRRHPADRLVARDRDAGA